MNKTMWGDKPYHSLDYELKERFHEKVYKVSLDGGMTCPNRDGTLDIRGCIFCSGKGSGDFAGSARLSITEQIDNGIAFVSRNKQTGNKYIAYFQSFTNTYAPVDYLRPLFLEAIRHPKVVMLAIGTRPDCLSAEVLDLLAECNTIKPVIVELGLQTIHPDTVTYIRRRYPTSVYDTAVELLKQRNIEVVTHVIAGLPGETKTDFLRTVSHVAKSGSDGIKLQLLHVLSDTDLATDYEKGLFSTLEKEEYMDWIADALAILPKEITIHRLTGDGPKDLLIAPLWSRNKRGFFNDFHRKLKEEHIWQGCHLTE